MPKTMTPNKQAWPLDRLALAERLWADGYKARFVAEQCGVTRNALLGMVHRKRWLRGVAVEEEEKPAKKSVVVRPRPTKPKPDKVVPQKITGEIRLLDLDSHACHWPVSGTGAATLFCGKAQDQNPPGSSYCPEHHKMSGGQSYGHGAIRLP
jgi:hypothetical protein